MNLPKLTGWRRTAAYAAFFALAFLYALQRTFPSEAVKQRILLEASALGWQVRVDEVAPAGFAGVRATNVVLESRDGVKVPIERVRASLRLWPLLLGRRSVRFDAVLFDGRVGGVAEMGKGWERLRLEAQGIDLARAAALKMASGVSLAGTLSADVDVTLDDREPAKSTGHLAVGVERAAVNGGEVPVPGMGGNLTLPRVALGRIDAEATMKDGKAVFDRLEARGEDLEIAGEQVYFGVQPRLEYAPVYGKVRLKVADGFWRRSGTGGLRGVVEMALAGARRQDGAYGFQLYGTLGHPQARPAAQ